MSRIFTMRKYCPACQAGFTITSAASVYCQDCYCKNKRRREDYAKRKAPRHGSDCHFRRAIRSAE